MSALRKLVERVLFEPESIDNIGEIRRLLEAFGYEERKKAGGECIFHKKGSFPINVPTVSGRKVKTVYVRRLVQILNLEEWYEENKE